jgi:pilus assembly protein Flp/PilA
MDSFMQLYTLAKAYFGLDRQDDEGASMVEYGLLVALIAIVVVAALLVLGPAIANLFNDASNNL